MATKGNMTLRIEPELKKQAADLFQSLGMDLSTATGIFYRQGHGSVPAFRGALLRDGLRAFSGQAAGIASGMG